MTPARIAVITPSYRNDFELARDLCGSMDEFMRFEHEHILIVPRSDHALFAPLAGPNRRVLTRESIIARHGFHRLPVPTVIPLPFGRTKRIREQYYLRGAGRVSGWLVQQIVKLSAAEFTDADIFVFADSDALLLRPFERETLYAEGGLHLQRHKEGLQHDTHQTWRRTAHRLLGIEAPRGEPFNYIGQLVTWSRPVLEALLRRVEETTGQDWRRAITEARSVSEYILYGEFVAESLREASGHAAGDRKIYNSVWSPDTKVDVDAILAAMQPHHVAVHIQSTNPIPIEERRRAVEAIRAGLAAKTDPSS